LSLIGTCKTALTRKSLLTYMHLEEKYNIHKSKDSWNHVACSRTTTV